MYLTKIYYFFDIYKFVIKKTENPKILRKIMG